MKVLRMRLGNWGGALSMLLLLLVGSVAAARAETLTLLVMETPGLFVSQPKTRVVEGRGVAVFTRLGALAGVDVRFEPSVTARAMRDAEQHPNTCIVGLARTPEREAHFKWAGLLARSRLVLMARATDQRRWADLQALRGFRIGAIRQSVVAGRLHAAGLPVEEVASDAISLRMLMAERIDLWATSDLTLRYELARPDAPRLREALELGVLESFLACHPQLDEALLARLNAALAQLVREGQFSTVKP